ncbi:MAG: flavodoxin family protein [Pseudomonadota bacterium]|jgi:multimeric flavodoxin WrbA
MPERRKIIAVNGSPRRTWNTATLLQKVLEGAASQGADTKLIHLYELDYTGCISCFACKTKDGDSYGRCAVRDDLQTLFGEIEKADAVVLGSPIYFGAVTGQMRCFMERWMYPYLTYTDPQKSLFPGKIRTAFVYTMGVNDDGLVKRGMQDFYYGHFDVNKSVLTRLFGNSTYMMAMDTLQFEDYSKVVADMFDPAEKARSRAERFPEDCEKAFALGAELTRP